jgi:hypothetical protein
MWYTGHTFGQRWATSACPFKEKQPRAEGLFTPLFSAKEPLERVAMKTIRSQRVCALAQNSDYNNEGYHLTFMPIDSCPSLQRSLLSHFCDHLTPQNIDGIMGWPVEYSPNPRFPDRSTGCAFGQL